MNGIGITFVDLLVVGVILVSALYAAYRGFVQESLSIFAWAAAAFASLYFGPTAVHLLEGAMSGWLAILVGYASVFMVVVIPLSFIGYRFAQNVSHSPVHILDRTLGFVFGVARGLVIVGAVYLVFSMIVPVAKQPPWMTNARLLPLIHSSSDVLAAVILDRKVLAESHRRHTSAREPVRRASRNAARDAQTAQSSKSTEKTYGARDRRALDKLIETTADAGGKKP